MDEMMDATASETSTLDLTILIADDHWVVRESLKQVARSIHPGIRTEEAASFDEALQCLERNPAIGLLLVDLIMPGFHDFEGLQVLRQQYPAVPVVVISVHEDPDSVLEAIRHGAIGYIPKSANAEEIKRALARVVSGEVTFPRDIIARGASDEGRIEAPRSATLQGEPRLSSLTAREGEIMSRLGRGLGLFDIANELGISRQTVRVHLGNAMKKLDLSSREGAIRFAVDHVKSLDGMMRDHR